MNEKGVSQVAVEVEITPSYTADAQARLQELRNMRDAIPRFIIPGSSKETSRLANAASVPPPFVELAAVALVNQRGIARVDGSGADELRDLMQYAEAYEPVADEMEAMAQFLRHSVVAARNKAGSEALMVYATARRLAKRPENGHLVPHVADMRRALGRVRKLTAEAVERRAAKKAADAAAVKAA
ncbi:MAG TPA: hypothetical protein VF618_18615 [Thermoanaerobaculia bacterium]